MQITGRSNYAKWSQRLGIDLINDPGLASDPAIAAKILVLGMRDGFFTGVGLSNYINGSKQDFFNARRIVNGDVRLNGQKIAQIAERYLNALRSASTSPTPTPTPTNPGQPPITGYREYIVKKGDFPSTIAQKELGNANRWREILKADNTPLTDFDATRLQIGQKLLLPVSNQSGPGTPVTQIPVTTPKPVSFEIGRVSSRVGSVSLNLRSQAQVTSQNRIDTLPVGKEMKILRSVTGATYGTSNGNRNDWYEVEVNGKRGFVAAFFVDKGSSAPPPPQSGFVNSNVGGGPLNLRSSASTNTVSTTKLNQGTNLKILGSVTGGTYKIGNSNRNDWYEVEVNGKRGFVAAYYVTKGTTQTNPGGGSSAPFTLREYYQRLYGHAQAASFRQFNTPNDGGHDAIDSNVTGNASRQVRALVGGKVLRAKNGVTLSNVSMNNTGYHSGLGRRVTASDYNGTVVIWNEELQREFWYLHFAPGSVNQGLVGKTINPGDVIGIEGETGFSIGVHTHVHVDNNQGIGGTKQDPQVILGNARGQGILDKRY